MCLPKIFVPFIFGILAFITTLCFALTPSIPQTQTQLKQLEIKINRLKHNLDKAHDKKGLLNQELSQTEKQMSEGVRQLRTIEHAMATREGKIKELHNSVRQLNDTLSSELKLLASHVRARYQMGTYQPLKGLLNEKNPYRFSQILTYYHYIIQARLELIVQIENTKKKIQDNKQHLKAEQSKTMHLQHELSAQQQQLQHHKSYHTTLIQTLNKEIQTHERDLKEVQKNKANLSNLLKSLVQQSTMQASKPFAQMRKKLPLPIQTHRRLIRKMNQGVTFFAEEGIAVTAVYPGKVVFSDWLNGYGLLLIIDHGQGFMTLYAHNKSLYKHKGQFVQQREQIASVGHSGGIKQNGLYFEIRQRGKAVFPLEWLS